MNFRQRYMNDECDFEEIFDETQKWNFSDETRTLREYLGLSAEEEDIWISESDEALEVLMEKEKKTKILFLDLDGTLLNDQKEITKGNLDAINQALEEGHKVVITTGRPLPSAKKLSKQLGLTKKGCYAIAYNGAQIYDLYQNRSVFKKTLPIEYVRYLLDKAYECGLHAHTYNETCILSERDTTELCRYESLTNLQAKVVEDVTKEMTEEPGKVIVIDYACEKLGNYEDAIRDWIKGKADYLYSCPEYLEIVAPGMSKGHAIEILCEELGIPMKNTVAAGDAANDLTMIQTAQIGAVMSNGSEEIKKAGDYVTEHDNNHDGVAEIIFKFILF